TFERFASGLTWGGCPAGSEGIASNTARERELTVLSNHEAAISARKRNHGQQTGCQLRATEIRFEREEVARPHGGVPSAAGTSVP
ncbi:MAG TPA: hypothetical protein VJ834_17195, partial [Burkholderiales bacterium]|nr:hypothetical protein [Burkholderiales bacterium]